VFIARGGRHELTTTLLTEEEVADLVERMLKTTGRRVDISQPFTDAQLPDGSRVHIVLGGITSRYAAVNIRKFTVRATRLADLVGLGSITPAVSRSICSGRRTQPRSLTRSCMRGRTTGFRGWRDGRAHWHDAAAVFGV
jgi:Flp pilus assembly CpaF family ATPase